MTQHIARLTVGAGSGQHTGHKRHPWGRWAACAGWGGRRDTAPGTCSLVLSRRIGKCRRSLKQAWCKILVDCSNIPERQVQGMRAMQRCVSVLGAVRQLQKMHCCIFNAKPLQGLQVWMG
jgi:hypothetical protein